MSQIVQRFRSYPPALQWVLMVMVVVLVVLFWHDLVWNRAQEWNEQAAAYERAVEESQRDAASLPRSVQEAVVAIGSIEPLGTDVEGAQSFAEEITRILGEHDVVGQETRVKAPVQFKNNEMPQIVPLGSRGQRLASEVRFEATQDIAFDVIAALERSPKIETVSTVQIHRAQDPRNSTVVVRLTAETWVLTSDARSAAGRTASR